MRTIIFLMLSFGSFFSMAQESFPFFSKSDQLPKDLLSKRAVVFINVNELQWDKEAEIIHKSFIQSGIDAVAYYALSDILSGYDATNAFYADITRRSIENMVIVHQEDAFYEIYLTKIPEEGGFFQEGMQAYHMQAADLKLLGAKLNTAIEKSSLRRENFLIIDIPETFKRTNVIKSRRVENFNPDLRIDKLAVPRFEKNIMLNIDVETANAELDTLMAKHYPFKYGLVAPNITDEEMISQGYLMVLRKLENNGESLRRMLGYRMVEDETLLISVRKGENGKVIKNSVSKQVHKYYIQQLYTKDIYLGNEWDADSTWQEALINHVENLKNQLKR